MNLWTGLVTKDIKYKRCKLNKDIITQSIERYITKYIKCSLAYISIVFKHKNSPNKQENN